MLGPRHTELHQCGCAECRFARLLRVTAPKTTPSKETKAQAHDRMRDKTDVLPASSPIFANSVRVRMDALKASEA
jgi:hypothetical protein